MHVTDADSCHRNILLSQTHIHVIDTHSCHRRTLMSQTHHDVTKTHSCHRHTYTYRRRLIIPIHTRITGRKLNSQRHTPVLKPISCHRHTLHKRKLMPQTLTPHTIMTRKYTYINPIRDSCRSLLPS